MFTFLLLTADFFLLHERFFHTALFKYDEMRLPKLIFRTDNGRTAEYEFFYFNQMHRYFDYDDSYEYNLKGLVA